MILIACVGCKRPMKVKKNGIGVRFGDNYVLPGDLYECKVCRREVILTSKYPVDDPDRDIMTVEMVTE